MNNYTAQICLNGHVINSRIDTYDEIQEEFCDECGKETITKCQKCKNEIPGRLLVSRVMQVYEPPKYCRKCGSAFPWTESKILALREIIDSEDKLNDDEKENLKESIYDMIKETPKTQASSLKFKVLLSKFSKESTAIVRAIIVNLVTETAKKILIPS